MQHSVTTATDSLGSAAERDCDHASGRLYVDKARSSLLADLGPVAETEKRSLANAAGRMMKLGRPNCVCTA